MIVLETQRIALTDEVRQKNLRGMLSVEIDLLASGIVGKIRIRGSAGHDMDYNAFDAARQIKFLPAEIDGKPVDSVLQIAYDFGIVKN
jgi:TonB family protein